MRLLFISENYPPYVHGGAEISTAILARRLAKEHEIMVASARIADAPWTDEGVEVRPLMLRASVGTKSAWSALRYAAGIVSAPAVSAARALRVVREFKPDAVTIVVTVYQFMPVALALSLFTRAPVFIDCRDYSLICPAQFKNDESADPLRHRHGYRCLMRGYRARGALRLFMAPFAAYESAVFNAYKSLLRYRVNHSRRITLVANSEYVRRQLILNGFSERKVVVINNISERPRDPQPPSARRESLFVFAGRVEKEKGVWDLVKAAELLRNEGAPPFRLAIAGSGSESVALRSYAEEKRLSNIDFPGLLPPAQVLALYQKALAIVAPVRWPEPFGRFILESISTGTPVIATSTGGTPEGIQDGETGVLVEAGNPRALARAMESFLRDPEKAGAMGAAMARSQARYDADLICEKRLALYRAAPPR